MGFSKSPRQYGAFPSDPYSHTPEHIGAQQPGMTGQVKEDILTRFGELGVFVNKGQIHIRPFLLKQSEFLKHGKVFTYFDLNSERKSIQLKKNSLAFTCCQIPVVYSLSNENKIVFEKKDGARHEISDLIIDQKNSTAIFERTGEIESIFVYLTPDKIFASGD